jgi:hypothetical protein
MAIIVPILTTFNDKGVKAAIKEFQRAQGAFAKTSVVVGASADASIRLGNALTRTVTPAIIAFGAAAYKATQLASDMAETQSKVGVIFGKTADDIRAFGKAAARNIGMSEQEALDAASTFALFGKQAGKADAELNKFAKDFVTLAADFASFYNTEPQEAIIAIGAALRGESEPIRRFNILLDEQTVRTRALKIGIIDNINQALTPQQKVLARTAEIFAQSSVAQGDFQRTSEGLANQQRILKAEITNLTTEFGRAFMPMMLQIVRVVRDEVIPRLQGFTQAFQKLSPETINTILKLGAFLAILGPLLIGIGFLAKALLTLARVFVVLQTSILRIPLAIAALIGLFAAQSDAQYKLAKETGDTWGMIGRLIVLGIKYPLMAIDSFINGIKFMGVSLEFIGDKVDNFFDKLTGGPGKSLVSFEQRVQNIKFTNLAGGLENIVDGFSEFNAEVADAAKESKIMAAEAQLLALETQGLTEELDKETNALGKTTEALKKVKQAAKDAAQVIVDNLEDSLQKAESALDDVRGKFNNFKDAIGSTITGILNFGKAAESENFLQGLAKQAENATDFANKVKQLVVLGLNERGIRQVLDAGFEAGSQIADEIIAGGATMVQQVNTLVDSIFGVAEQVGDFGAVAFYDAGVKQAEAMVDGIKTELERARAELKSIVEGLTTTAPSGGAPSATQAPADERKTDTGTKLQPGKLLTSTQFAKAANVLKTSGTAAASYTALAYALQNKTVKMAKGGIVTGPTNALIGEAGPEAVIPLSGANSAGMGATYNIVVNAGIGTSGSQVGREIVDAIKKFEKTSGPVFASA